MFSFESRRDVVYLHGLPPRLQRELNAIQAELEAKLSFPGMKLIDTYWHLTRVGHTKLPSAVYAHVFVPEGFVSGLTAELHESWQKAKKFDHMPGGFRLEITSELILAVSKAPMPRDNEVATHFITFATNLAQTGMAYYRAMTPTELLTDTVPR